MGKWPHKKIKKYILFEKVQDVLFSGLKASPVAWTYFIKA
jgi:hypothetical protein